LNGAQPSVAKEVFGGVNTPQVKGNVFLDLMSMDCVLQQVVHECRSVTNADGYACAYESMCRCAVL
jgi:hypothetical protein